jgi:hypothetical protein
MVIGDEVTVRFLFIHEALLAMIITQFFAIFYLQESMKQGGVGRVIVVVLGCLMSSVVTESEKRGRIRLEVLKGVVELVGRSGGG